MIPFLAGFITGVLAGVFVTMLVLTAVDTRRWGRARRPYPTAARHGVRATLLSDVAPPRAVTVPAGHTLERAGRSL